ncbi:hypothetical protein D3C85_1795940 [compost metagenome]
MTEAVQQGEAWALVVEVDTAPTTVERGIQYAITLEQPTTVVVGAGQQGPPGPPGGGAAEWQANEW